MQIDYLHRIFRNPIFPRPSVVPRRLQFYDGGSPTNLTDYSTIYDYLWVFTIRFILTEKNECIGFTTTCAFFFFHRMWTTHPPEIFSEIVLDERRRDFFSGQIYFLKFYHTKTQILISIRSLSEINVSLLLVENV